MNRQTLHLRKAAMAWLLAMVMLSTLLVASLSPSAASGPEHNINCVKFGNVDLDANNSIDIDDILAVRSHMFGLTALTGKALIAADILETGVIDIDVILAIRGDMFGTTMLEWSCMSGIKYPTHPPIPSPMLTSTPQLTATPVPTATPYVPFDLDSLPQPDELVHFRGALLNEAHTVPNLFLNQVPSSSHKLVFYATSGTGWVNGMINQLVQDYWIAGIPGGDPAANVPAETARDFLNACDKYLKFYFDVTKVAGYSAVYSVRSAVEVQFYGRVRVDPDTGEKYITPVGEDGGAPFDPYEMSSRGYPNRGYMQAMPEALWKYADAPAVENSEFPDLDLEVSDTLSLKMKYIPAGDMLQGSPYYQGHRWQDEYPHKITLTKAYYMAEIPITQEIWLAVMDDYPAMMTEMLGRAKAPGEVWYPSKKGNPLFCIEVASITEIKEFLRRLGEKNNVTLTIPTCNQWEYAARCGDSKIPTTFRQTISSVGLTDQSPAANVKRMAPNAWGLYDMQSNAWEWTSRHKGDLDKTGNERWDVEDQENQFHLPTPDIWKTKGGYFYNTNTPAMHGAVYDSGASQEGPITFRICADDADAIIELLELD